MNFFLILLSIISINSTSSFKGKLFWNLANIFYGDATNFRKDILEIVVVTNSVQPFLRGVTGVFNLKRNMDNNFEVILGFFLYILNTKNLYSAV